MRSVILAVVVSGCAIGAPPGFSEGDTWTFPLVDPLSDGRLLTPVYVEGRGPYLFAIDPDAVITVADPEVVANGSFRAHMGPRRVDQADVTHPTHYTDLTAFRVGDLTVSLLHVMVSEGNAFDADGRRIYGVIGHDVIADSLVFGFDRDRGIAWLTTHEAFHPPTDAYVIEWKKAFTNILPLPRRLVDVTIDGVEHELHADFGAAPSQLDRDYWDAAKLRTTDWHMTLVDETGTTRKVDQLGIAQRVIADGVERTGIAFAPYADKRFFKQTLDGTLGLDFFRPFIVEVDWHHTKIYLRPRQPTSASKELRAGRWSDPGPVHVELIPPSAPLPADQRPILHVIRTGDTGPRELVLAATKPDAPALRGLVVELPAGVIEVSSHLDTLYLGATVEVVDSSPFPRNCPQPGGCVMVELPPVP